ncbi:MAG: sulfurtransferase TusA family protein [candidate division KSB1 bacterium]|nr:sulfurtransferase TusA family protein [candidate division KSB1 bacterium]MDZ7336883.1 sulfurtransferase TusA family protein [candidate division KSB1 bacterium]
MKADFTIDCLGLYCPMPIIKTAEKIKELSPGQILEVISDDPGFVDDMPNWCKMTGHEFLEMQQEGEEYRAYVRKVGG